MQVCTTVPNAKAVIGEHVHGHCACILMIVTHGTHAGHFPALSHKLMGLEQKPWVTSSEWLTVITGNFTCSLTYAIVY